MTREAHKLQLEKPTHSSEDLGQPKKKKTTASYSSLVGCEINLMDVNQHIRVYHHKIVFSVHYVCVNIYRTVI